MNLSDLPNANAMAARLTEINAALAANPQTANFVITLPNSTTTTIALQPNEIMLGLKQLQGEITASLAALGVNLAA